MTADHEYVLRVENIHKELHVGEVTVKALRGVSMNVKRGEFLGIIGPSGSGKSTLMGLIGGLDTPTSGEVFINNENITHLNERELTKIRNEKIGFVFQSFNLIPTLSALENVSLPIQFARNSPFNASQRARELLDMLGLGDRFHHRPTQLSGGQQQRVAIARALANNPPLLLADEPTGNLDTDSSEIVLEALETVRRDFNTTVIVVTHDMSVAARVERIVTLIDGKVASDDPRSTAQLSVVQTLKEKRATGEMPVANL